MTKSIGRQIKIKKLTAALRQKCLDEATALVDLSEAIEAVRLLLPWADIGWDRSREFTSEVAQWKTAVAKANAVLAKAAETEEP